MVSLANIRPGVRREIEVGYIDVPINIELTSLVERVHPSAQAGEFYSQLPRCVSTCSSFVTAENTLNSSS